MNLDKSEVLEVQRTASEAIEVQVRELSELQLALVGGGIGETVL